MFHNTTDELLQRVECWGAWGWGAWRSDGELQKSSRNLRNCGMDGKNKCHCNLTFSWLSVLPRLVFSPAGHHA